MSLTVTVEAVVEPTLRLRLLPAPIEPTLRLQMHKGFVVLSGVNESKIFDKVESLVKDYSENADKIAAFKASVDAFDDPMAVLDHELIASLYERHNVPHALQHDAFSQEFVERWRSRIDDMIARSLAEPDEQHTLNLLFLHSAKVLNKSFLAKAIVVECLVPMTHRMT